MKELATGVKAPRALDNMTSYGISNHVGLNTVTNSVASRKNSMANKIRIPVQSPSMISSPTNITNKKRKNFSPLNRPNTFGGAPRLVKPNFSAVRPQSLCQLSDDWQQQVQKQQPEEIQKFITNRFSPTNLQFGSAQSYSPQRSPQNRRSPKNSRSPKHQNLASIAIQNGESCLDTRIPESAQSCKDGLQTQNMLLRQQIYELQNVIVSMSMIQHRQSFTSLQGASNEELLGMTRKISKSVLSDKTRRPKSQCQHLTSAQRIYLENQKSKLEIDPNKWHHDLRSSDLSKSPNRNPTMTFGLQSYTRPVGVSMSPLRESKKRQPRQQKLKEKKEEEPEKKIPEQINLQIQSVQVRNMTSNSKSPGQKGKKRQQSPFKVEMVDEEEEKQETELKVNPNTEVFITTKIMKKDNKSLPRNKASLKRKTRLTEQQQASAKRVRNSSTGDEVVQFNTTFSPVIDEKLSIDEKRPAPRQRYSHVPSKVAQFIVAGKQVAKRPFSQSPGMQTLSVGSQNEQTNDPDTVQKMPFEQAERSPPRSNSGSSGLKNRNPFLQQRVSAGLEKSDSIVKRIQPPTPILSGPKNHFQTKVSRITSITPTVSVTSKLSKSAPKYHRAKAVKNNNPVIEKIEKQVRENHRNFPREPSKRLINIAVSRQQNNSVSQSKMLGIVAESNPSENVSSIEKFLTHTMSMASNMQQHIEQESLNPLNEGQTTLSLIHDIEDAMQVDVEIKPEEVKANESDAMPSAEGEMFKTVDEARNVQDEETPNVIEEKKKINRGREISVKRGGLGLGMGIKKTNSTGYRSKDRPTLTSASQKVFKPAGLGIAKRFSSPSASNSNAPKSRTAATIQQQMQSTGGTSSNMDITSSRNSSTVKSVPKLALDAVFKQQIIDQHNEGVSDDNSMVNIPKADVELKKPSDTMVTGIKLPTQFDKSNKTSSAEESDEVVSLMQETEGLSSPDPKTEHPSGTYVNTTEQDTKSFGVVGSPMDAVSPSPMSYVNSVMDPKLGLSEFAIVSISSQQESPQPTDQEQPELPAHDPPQPMIQVDLRQSSTKKTGPKQTAPTQLKPRVYSPAATMLKKPLLKNVNTRSGLGNTTKVQKPVSQRRKQSVTGENKDRFYPKPVGAPSSLYSKAPTPTPQPTKKPAIPSAYVPRAQAMTVSQRAKQSTEVPEMGRKGVKIAEESFQYLNRGTKKPPSVRKPIKTLEYPRPSTQTIPQPVTVARAAKQMVRVKLANEQLSIITKKKIETKENLQGFMSTKETYSPFSHTQKLQFSGGNSTIKLVPNQLSPTMSRNSQLFQATNMSKGSLKAKDQSRQMSPDTRLPIPDHLLTPIITNSSSKKTPKISSLQLRNSMNACQNIPISTKEGASVESADKVIKNSNDQRISAQKAIELKILESQQEILKLKALRDQLLQTKTSSSKKGSNSKYDPNRIMKGHGLIHTYNKFEQTNYFRSNSGQKRQPSGSFSYILDEITQGGNKSVGRSSNKSFSRKSQNSDFKDLAECRDLFPLKTVSENSDQEVTIQYQDPPKLDSSEGSQQEEKKVEEEKQNDTTGDMPNTDGSQESDVDLSREIEPAQD